MIEEDLLYLNRKEVERLNLLDLDKSKVQLAQFAESDRVSFSDNNGAHKHGRAIRFYKKTISLISNDRHQWKVLPGFPLTSTD